MSNIVSVPNPRDWVSAGRDLRTRSRGLAIASAFYSPKNRSVVSLWGVSAFCHLTLCEGNPNVRAFRPIRAKDIVSGQMRQLADVSFASGTHEIWAFSSNFPANRKAEFDGITEPVVWKTTEELSTKTILISNWICLRACMSRIRDISTYAERAVINELLTRDEEITLRRLVESPGTDYGTMLGEIASQLARGELHSELETRHFDLLSTLWRRR